MTSFPFPYRIGSDGRTATSSMEEHLRGLVLQVLLTLPGERVNRPDLGTGLYQLVFEPAGPELAQALEYSVRGGLQARFSDRLIIDRVAVEGDGSAVRVDVAYRRLHDGVVGTASVTEGR